MLGNGQAAPFLIVQIYMVVVSRLSAARFYLFWHCALRANINIYIYSKKKLSLSHSHHVHKREVVPTCTLILHPYTLRRNVHFFTPDSING
jgi:hypothetical protein